MELLEGRALLSLTATMDHIAAVEGTAFTGAVASFTSTDPSSAAVTATINWGDGTSSQGTIAPDPAGGFDVNGTHTYREEGTYRVRVGLSDTAGSKTVAQGPANVLDAPLTITAQPFSATEGKSFSGPVATFNDGDPGATPGEFRATINWGDGTTSRGTVSALPGGGFQVSGTHTYTEEGAFPAVVTVRDGRNNVATTGFGNQTNLDSNIPGLAASTDPGLVNPWGISFGATSPFWISDNGTGLATLFNGAGAKQGLIVTIPPPTGGTPPSAPTGQVNNANPNEFLVDPTNPKSSAHFIFDTEDGTISAWNSGTAAALKVDNSAQSYPNGGVGAVYKGLALAGNGGSDFLYATNFRSGNVDVFDSAFKPAGSFTDPSLTAIGYAPFGIATIGGNLYVTFAKQDATRHDDVAGLGNGYIDEFSPAGTMLARIASNGPLDSPWGLAMAPSGFGKFSGDLLVGNFGNGRINAFDPTTHAFVGALTAGGSGKPIEIDGLWAIAFGNGQKTASPTTLYFTAGTNGEQDGLFGTISPGPQLAEAATVAEGDQLTGVPTVAASFRDTTVSGTVALFLDSDRATPAGDFTATIDWGDGSTSTGVVRGGNGLFRVSGTHTYATAGTYQVKVTLTDDAPGTAQAVAQSTALAFPLFGDGGHDRHHHHGDGSAT